MICDKEKYGEDICFWKWLTTAASPTLTKVYEFTAPCDGILDASIFPIWSYVQPLGSSICMSSDGSSYNTIAAADDGDTPRAVGCSVSGYYLPSGTTMYFFARVASQTNQATVRITGRFHPITVAQETQ